MCGWKMRRRRSLQNNSIIDGGSAGNKGPVLWLLVKDPRRRQRTQQDKKRRGSKAAQSRRSLWEIKGSPSFSHTQNKALGTPTRWRSAFMGLYLDVVPLHPGPRCQRGPADCGGRRGTWGAVRVCVELLGLEGSLFTFQRHLKAGKRIAKGFHSLN